MIICNIIVIPNKKPRFQKELIWRGQGYDCKWDFISNTKYNLQVERNLIDRNKFHEKKLKKEKNESVKEESVLER